MPQIYNNDLTPSLWGTGGKIKPQSALTGSNLTIGGLNGQIQYNDNGALNGTSESFYDKTVGMLTLGPVSNVNITGGIPGQVLTKDAYGNMIWANSNIPNQPQIHFDVPVTGVAQSFAHPNIATFQDSTYAGVFRNGILMPTDAYVINGSVLSINTMLLAGDRVDVLETAAGIVQTGNIGNVNLNGDPTTFLDGTGNWQFIQPPTVVGTVAPLNLDGNIAHWLRGDGVWANIPVAVGNISNIDLNGNTVQFLNGAGVWTNIAVPTGNIANTNYDGNADHYLNGQGNWVPVVSGGIPGGSNTQLQFNNNGVFGGVPNSSFDGNNLTLGSNANIKLTGGNVDDVLITDGTGNLSWRSLVNYAAVPRMEFQVLSNGSGQTFTNANLAVYPNSNYATVFRNGVLMDPTDYVISGTGITFPIPLYAGESIDIAASASVGNGGGGTGNGSVTTVNTAGSGLGFTLTGGPITTTGTVTLTTPNVTELRTNLAIGNVANANFTGNGNVVLSGNGAWIDVAKKAPYIEWDATVSGTGQTFTNGNLSLYGDKTDVSLFRNGVLVSPSDYSLSGNNLTISTLVSSGDNLEVISKLASAVTTGGTTPSAGNIGQLQFAGAGNTFAASNRHYIGGNGTTSINSSVDGILAQFVGAAYSNTAATQTIGAARARGTKAAPLPVQVGDRVFNLFAAPYTGNGTSTIDGISGWCGDPISSLRFGVTSLPTVSGGTPGTQLTMRVCNSSGNTSYAALFSENGVFAVPKLAISIPNVPASSTAPGIPGEIAWANGFIYVCVATDTWQRSPLATW
jgi:hypothetical protein